MRNFFITLVVVLAVAVAAFGVCYFLQAGRAEQRVADEGDGMIWLRDEFHLTSTQFAAIQQLHLDYNEECMRHCALIMEARDQKAPVEQQVQLEVMCEKAMTEHFHRVAALMSPGEGVRYLAVVLPRVKGYSHHAAPSLKVLP